MAREVQRSGNKLTIEPKFQLQCKIASQLTFHPDFQQGIKFTSMPLSPLPLYRAPPMKRAYCYCDRIIALLVLCNFCTLPFVCYSILFFLLVRCCCCLVWKSIIADFCPSIFSALMPTVRNVQQERPAKVGITKFDTHENGMAWIEWESERETESKSLWVSFASLKCAFWVVSCQYTVIVCIVPVFAQLKSIIFATDNVFCVYVIRMPISIFEIATSSVLLTT